MALKYGRSENLLHLLDEKLLNLPDEDLLVFF